MTKEQAIQALEQAGRKGSDAYEELAALEAKKADVESKAKALDEKKK